MSADYKISCPGCGGSIEVPAEMLGQVGECPYCDKSIRIPGIPKHESSLEKTKQALSTTYEVTKKSFFVIKSIFEKVKNALPDKPPPRRESNLLTPKAPATENQLKYIEALGGMTKKKINMQQASDLIQELIIKQPATEKQLKQLEREGVDISKALTKIQATELITKIKDAKPPTKKQISLLNDFGADIPKTQGEASVLCEKLKQTSNVTKAQMLEANRLGGVISPSTTYLEAEDLINDLETDNDQELGKPPEKDQIKKIVKLGGDPSLAKNRWRADEYIEKLEEQAEEFEERIEEAIDCFFGEPDDREIMSVKKPSKAIMKKALLYGEGQGWGPGWEMDVNLDYFALLDFSIYTIAPERLKDGCKPPQMPKHIYSTR